MNVEDAFTKVVGRQATQEERERLHRLRDALGLHENDAFWSIVMALEHYDAFFRRYPAELADKTRESIEQARVAFAVAAEHEAAQVQRLLSEKVAETSVQIARKLAERPIGIHRVTLMLAAVIAFGTLCVHAGYSLATADRPFWVMPKGNLHGATKALSAILGAPAGWMVFALLLPAAGYGLKVGWELAHDSVAEQREKAAGWCIVGLCILGMAACAVVLAKVT